MTNFKYLCENCKTTKNFLCHIFYKNHHFQCIENNLQELLSIHEDDIFYFEGAWSIGEDNFRRISTVYTIQYAYEFFCGYDIYLVLGVQICHNLLRMGVKDFESITIALLQIYSNYKKNTDRTDCKGYFKINREWKKYIKKWMKDPISILTKTDDNSN